MTKVTIEREGQDTVVLELNDFAMKVEKRPKWHDKKTYTIGLRHAALEGWLDAEESDDN